MIWKRHGQLFSRAPDMGGDGATGTSSSVPRRLHLDRRAAEIAEKGRHRDPTDLLTTKEMAAWLGVSTQWLEIARGNAYGPPFERIGPRHIRYMVGKTLKWLDERTHRCTAEYA